MTLATANFARDVWNTVRSPQLAANARRLWGDDYEDGMAETVCRAIAHKDKFAGSANLGGWLAVMMVNIRRDQLAKGYAKGGKVGKHPPEVAQGRLTFVGSYDELSASMVDLCDPESILIAKETYSDLQHR